MKKIPLILLSVLGLVACNRHKLVVSGNITNADTLQLYLEEVDIYQTNKLDSVKLNHNGNFRFKISLPNPGFYQLELSGGQNVVLFPKPGDHIIVQADRKNLLSTLQVEGSFDTEQVLKLVKDLSLTKARLDSINVQFEQTNDNAMLDSLQHQYEDIIDAHRKFSIAFILTHYNSLSSLYALYQQYQPGSYVFYRNTDLQYFKIVTDSLKKYYPDARHVKALEAFTDRLIGNYNASLVLKLAENTEPSLPEVALPGLTGDTITLQSVNAPYVLLDFWASWSPESVDMNRQLIKIYNDFKRKGFEVLAVSLDNSSESWTRAIKFDELNWINVIDEKYPNSMAAARYNVTELPATYLIDLKNKTILGKNLSTLQLQERLSQLLN